MALPLPLDYPAMEAKLVSQLPEGPQWQYEPKWDGFRCLAFKDGDDIALRSKSGQPLERYFPEVVAAIAGLSAKQFVIDGELVIPIGNTLSFDDLLMRIHPAASRVTKLSREHPARYVVFDLLVDDKGDSLVDLPLVERKTHLAQFAERVLRQSPTFALSSITHQREQALAWLGSVLGVDGIVAKRVDLPYQSGSRTGMQKYKRIRTADCVVGGFRYGTNTKVVGSLLLGLYDDDGVLHHVGFTSNIPAGEREPLTRKLESLVKAPGFTGRAPGGPSRWSTERSGEWQPLATELVVEVQYDYWNGERCRHGTKFLRWRPEKSPRQCTMAQLNEESKAVASTSYS